MRKLECRVSLRGVACVADVKRGRGSRNFSVLIRQVEKRTNQLQEESVRQANRKFRVNAGQMEWLKEQYPVTAHAPNFDFRTGCPEINRCEESKRSLKNPFASRLAEFDTTLKLLRITDQWYIVPVKFQFGQIRVFMALLLLPLDEGPKDGKRFDADWRLIPSASFHTSSDNCKRNTQKWNRNNKTL